MSKIVGIGNAIVDIVLDLDSEKVLKENAIPKGSN